LTRFLLDANLSPRTARRLRLEFGLDVVSLLELGLGEISDRDVRQMASVEHRVIVTLDRDFLEPFETSGRIAVGVIYLDLPDRMRSVAGVNRVLGRFFRLHAESIDLERSVVVVRQYEVIIQTEQD
jgi:predicted nuclease of predicted toxin-antitoxin system